MGAPESENYRLLTVEEYLLDPPESVWMDLLIADHAAWIDVRDIEVVRMTEARARAYGGDITREAWLGLYSPASPLKRTPPDGLAVAHSIFRRAGDLDEWAALRTSIGADEVAAAFGAAHFVRELIDRLPDEVKEEMREAQEAQGALNDLCGQIDAFTALSAGHPAQGPSGATAIEALERRLQELQKQEKGARERAEKAAQETLAALDGAAARTEQALAASVAAAAAGLADLRGAAREFGFGWGLGASAGASRQEIEGLQALADHLRRSPHLRKLVDLLGWAKRSISAERRKSRYGREKFTHYRTQELDLETIAPEELMGMVDPDPDSAMSLDFVRRALDGELLHRQYEGDEQAGRGPFVILADKSGSMRGWPNATACALELALMKVAIEERRRFVSIPFAGETQYEVFDPGPRPGPSELVEHLELFYGGGTEPYGPLDTAVRLVQEDPSLKEGDILIITDGTFEAPSAGFLDRLAAAREEPGLKLVAIVVKGSPGQAAFADQVVQVQDLFEERERLVETIAPLV